MIPLGIAGRSMMRITKDELKSAANDDISTTVLQLAQDIDRLYIETWLSPLLLVASGIDNPLLGPREKISLIQAGMQNIVDVVACQVSIRGTPDPILITKDDFTQRLHAAGLHPKAELLTPAQQLTAHVQEGSKDIVVGDLRHLTAPDQWLLTIFIPLQHPIAGYEAVFSAVINLDRLRQMIDSHPFNRSGSIALAEADGHRIFDPERTDLSQLPIVMQAQVLGDSPARAIAVSPTVRPDGEKMLSGFSSPTHLNWLVIVERAERQAYLAVAKMGRTLTMLIVLGLAIAVAGALVLALQISRPIEAMARVAHEVGEGHLEVNMQPLRSRDEIAALAVRMNGMISGLRQREVIRDTFGRYVSDEVVNFLLESSTGLALGGERRDVTIMMTDLRGFTAIGEQLPPENIVHIINIYLETMTEVITKYGGTIDEFIGDAILVIFGAPIARPDDPQRAVACALEMQLAMDDVNWRCREAGYPAIAMGIGINTGEVVVGNIGSFKRTKYGVVGHNVNLTARIESYTVGGQTLISPSTRDACGDLLRLDSQMEVMPKGVQAPIVIHEVGGIGGSYNVFLPKKSAIHWRDVVPPLEVTFTILEGKHASDNAHCGRVVRLSPEGAQLHVDVAAQTLDNLKMELFDHMGKAITHDLYAKIMERHTASGELTIHFTSVPPVAKAFLDECLAA